jgi:D-serine deaminase-like pyridoxal phosphate-dependent protein
MQFFKDLVNSEVVYRSLPCAPSVAIEDGCAMQLTSTAATTQVTTMASTWIDFAGVYVGPTVASTSGTVALGTSREVKCIINPFAIYLAPYDTSAITSTGFATKTITATHEMKAGDWVLYRTGVATGQIQYLASTSTTTTATVVSTPGITPGATDTFSHIRGRLTGQLAAQYGRIDLNAAATKIKSGASYAGVGINLIDNHIRSDKGTSLQPLRFATHDNTVDTTYQVFGEIHFPDNIWIKQ